MILPDKKLEQRISKFNKSILSLSKVKSVTTFPSDKIFLSA